MFSYVRLLKAYSFVYNQKMAEVLKRSGYYAWLNMGRSNQVISIIRKVGLHSLTTLQNANLGRNEDHPEKIQGDPRLICRAFYNCRVISDASLCFRIEKIYYPYVLSHQLAGGQNDLVAKTKRAIAIIPCDKGNNHFHTTVRGIMTDSSFLFALFAGVAFSKLL